MIRRPPRSTQSRSSAASDVYKRQNEATLRAEYGIDNGYRVDPDSISVSVYKLESERWYLLPPALSSEGIIFFNTTTAGPASQTVLNSINVELSSSESYRIVVNYKVLALAGV